MEAEKTKLQEELSYTEGFLKSVQVKLTNERFMASAPPKVVEMERNKEKDALHKISLLTEQINRMS